MVATKEQNWSYIGWTQFDEKHESIPQTRLDQHNRKTKGGAKATARLKGEGRLTCMVTGFESKNEAMSFEAIWKKRQPRVSGVLNRMRRGKELIKEFERLEFHDFLAIVNK